MEERSQRYQILILGTSACCCTYQRPGRWDLSYSSCDGEITLNYLNGPYTPSQVSYKRELEKHTEGDVKTEAEIGVM